MENSIKNKGYGKVLKVLIAFWNNATLNIFDLRILRFDIILKGEREMVYGYCRVSTRTQIIQRQVDNIKSSYPDADIIEEAYTGRTEKRPKWSRLRSKLKKGDILIFDSVSRMSRNADTGFKLYKELYEMGVELIFLKEPYINTTIYKEALGKRIELTGESVDVILEGINKYFLILAEEQVKLAFAQAEKEVEDLRQRTREGMRVAKNRGKQIGAVEGKKLTTKKSIESKEVIKKHSKDFGGSLKDMEVMKLAGISRNSYYKYKRELFEQLEQEALQEDEKNM